MSTESWKSIAGSATDEQKEKVVLWFGFLTQNFAGDVVKRIKPVHFDVTLGGNTQNAEPTGIQKNATFICDLVVEEDMTNGYRILHGGCAAFLVDVCTSVLLSAFSNAHVTLNLNVDYHQPIPAGITIEIISTTRAIGKRILSTRFSTQGKAHPATLRNAYQDAAILSAHRWLYREQEQALVPTYRIFSHLKGHQELEFVYWYHQRAQRRLSRLAKLTHPEFCNLESAGSKL